MSVECDLAALDAGIALVSPLPQTMADDRRRVRGARLVRDAQEATEYGTYTERLEVIAADYGKDGHLARAVRVAQRGTA